VVRFENNNPTEPYNYGLNYKVFLSIESLFRVKVGTAGNQMEFGLRLGCERRAHIALEQPGSGT
jgi:hypothetical protein